MSYKVYPVVKTKDECADYEVYVNGVKAELNTARVSAYPFNRRWPGHQRQIEQSELANFLSMESDEEVELKIVPKIPSYAVRIRPRDLMMKANTDANGVITPTAVNSASVQKRHGVDADVAGEFRLCDDFTVYQHAQVSLYGAASVTFTGFAIQKNGFTGDNLTGQELTKSAWDAIKGSFPYNTGIVDPVNPYSGLNGDDKAYVAVAGVAEPKFELLTPPVVQTPGNPDSQN